MPFTPFHMGPALVVKSAFPRSFSLPIFGITQVAIDSEVLIGFLVRGDLSNHAVLHTLAGSSAVAMATLLLLVPVCHPLFRFWNRTVGAKPHTFWHVGTPVPWPAAILSALAGGWSHALLDALMHRYNTPFAPLSNVNWLYSSAWAPVIVPICIASAICGGFVLLRRSFQQRIRGNGVQSDGVGK